jgi:hypothetical protein
LFDRPDLVIWAFVLCVPFYIGIAKIFFGGWDRVLDALRLMLQPQWLLALPGETRESKWIFLKFLCYLLACLAVATTVYQFLLEAF